MPPPTARLGQARLAALSKVAKLCEHFSNKDSDNMIALVAAASSVDFLDLVLRILEQFSVGHMSKSAVLMSFDAMRIARTPAPRTVVDARIAALSKISRLSKQFSTKESDKLLTILCAKDETVVSILAVRMLDGFATAQVSKGALLKSFDAVQADRKVVNKTAVQARLAALAKAAKHCDRFSLKENGNTFHLISTTQSKELLDVVIRLFETFAAGHLSKTALLLPLDAVEADQEAERQRRKAACPLLYAIPPELRNKIYELAFTQPRWATSDMVELGDAVSPSNALLRTNKQIHAEAKGLYRSAYRSFWSETSFLVNTNLLPDLPLQKQYLEDIKTRVREIDISHVTNVSLRFRTGAVIWDTGVWHIVDFWKRPVIYRDMVVLVPESKVSILKAASIEVIPWANGWFRPKKRIRDSEAAKRVLRMADKTSRSLHEELVAFLQWRVDRMTEGTNPPFVPAGSRT